MSSYPLLAPDYCVRPPRELGAHTQLITSPPATGTPTFWAANAKIRQGSPSLINQEYVSDAIILHHITSHNTYMMLHK